MRSIKFCKINHAIKIAAISMVLSLSNNVLAQEAQPNTGWSGLLSIGLNGSDGNNQSTAFNVGLNLVRNANFSAENPYRHNIGATYKFADWEQPNGETVDTRNQQSLQYSLDYAFSDKGYVTGILGYYSDEVAGIDTFHRAGLEYKAIVYSADGHELKVKAGLVQFDVQYTDDEEISGTGGIAGFDYTGALTDAVTLKLQAETQETSDLVYRIGKAALNYKLTEHTSVALTHNLTFFSDVPEGKDRTDTLTAIELKYTF